MELNEYCDSASEFLSRAARDAARAAARPRLEPSSLPAPPSVSEESDGPLEEYEEYDDDDDDELLEKVLEEEDEPELLPALVARLMREEPRRDDAPESLARELESCR